MNDKLAAPYRYLPHSYPFVMIDKIVEYEEGVRVVCVKNVTENEEFFQGSFLDKPVMPWSLAMEAMAQTAGLLLGKDCKGAFVSGMNRFNIKKEICPGDLVYITAENLGRIGPVHRFAVNAKVEEDVALEGEVYLTEFV